MKADIKISIMADIGNAAKVDWCLKVYDIAVLQTDRLGKQRYHVIISVNDSDDMTGLLQSLSEEKILFKLSNLI